MSEFYSKFYKTLLDNLYDGVYFCDRERKITYWNKGAERITGFNDAEVIGSHCWDNILGHVNEEGVTLCKSKCPLARTIKDGRFREADVYLRHKKGYRVPVLVRITPLRDAKRKIIGGVEIFSDTSSKVAYRAQITALQKLALFDPLTEVGNRRYLEMNLHSKVNEMERYKWPFGVMFIDIDHFKKINDTYGHQVGDEALKLVAKTLVINSRSFDIIGRWGGEEFLAIMINVDEAQLLALANKFRVLVETANFFSGTEKIPITVSIGATVGKSTDSLARLIERADRLMYQSKKMGRNRVTMRIER